MPKIHLPFTEYFNSRSENLKWKWENIEFPGPFIGMESFKEARLYNGIEWIATMPIFDEANGDIIVELYSEHFNDNIKQIASISSEYESETGLTVHIKQPW